MIDQQVPPTNADCARGDDQRRRVLAVCLVLAAITFAVFGRTLGFGFVNYDDNEYVYENSVVSQGLTVKGVTWAFYGAHAANWHPLTWLSHELDCQLYGLHPAGHHLTNVLLHTATVILLFLILRQMTGALWRSAFVAAVFAIHPLRVESVAWVSERKDVLSGLFFMLTVGAYIRYARGPRSLAHYGWVMLMFALGLLCKPMLVTLPLVLLVLDRWPLRRDQTWGKLLTEKLPLCALSAASCVATLLAQYKGIQSVGAFSLPMRLANAVVAGSVYIGQMFYPAGLVAFYPYKLDGLPGWEVALAGLLLAGLLAIAWWQRSGQPWLLSGWLWYLIMLLPVVGIIQVGDQAHADRYTYLPQIGLYIAVTWLVGEWAAKWRLNRRVLAGLMAGAVAVLMICAWTQAAYWENSETLWTHAIACVKPNDVPHFNLGNAFRQQGRMDDAVAQYEQALQIKPDLAQAHDNLGHVLLLQGKAAEAIPHFQKALQIRPDLPNAHLNLGNALRKVGKVDEAIAELRTSLQIRPKFEGAHLNLGQALFQEGKVDEAISEYQNALQLNPRDAEAHFDLGVALLQKGRVDEAISQFQGALQIRPKYILAESYLGNAFLQKGMASAAISHFQQALKIDPANTALQNNLAWLLATWPEASVRNGSMAISLAEHAKEVSSGNNPFILCTLAAAYAEGGRFSEAVETAQHALHLAEAQSNPALASQLQTQIKLYQAKTPFHLPQPTH